MLRIPSRLSDELEELIHRVIGCCIAVHRALGPGLLETIYVRALCLELEAADIPFEVERAFPVKYRDKLLYHQKVDLVVAGQLVLEIKSVDHLSEVHRAQLLCYLKVARLSVGLLINFNVPILQEGIKRLVV
jgi:GxxExxY protein